MLYYVKYFVVDKNKVQRALDRVADRDCSLYQDTILIHY